MSRDDQAYFSQLDFIRAIAVLMTLSCHWLFELGLISESSSSYLEKGVDIFFALSGFLITSILLRKRDLTFDTFQSKLKSIRNFFFRRVLRLFPAYYLFVFVLLISHWIGLKFWDGRYWYLYFTYTVNFVMSSGYWNKSLGHIWTLCVEEQFYLIWPWFIFFVKKKYTLLIIIMFLSIGIVSYSISGHSIRYLAWGNFQTLGIGALLAYFRHYMNNSSFFLTVDRHSKYFFWFFFSGYVLYQIFGMKMLDEGFVGNFIDQLLFVMTLFCLVLATVKGWQGFMGMLADNKQLQYLGRISYGIYLYHKSVPFALSAILKFQMQPVVLIALYLFITIIIASLSYRLLELPFLRLKTKFQ